MGYAKNNMTEDKRAEVMATLEAAVGRPIEGHDAEWLRFMDLLKLSGCFLPAVKEALEQGRWRQAKNPWAYIKTVARREALKTGLVDSAAEPNMVTDDGGGRRLDFDRWQFAASGFGPTKTNSGVWHQGSGEFADDYERDYNEFGEPLTRFLERLAQHIPHDLRKPDTDTPDWDKIAQRAQLDSGEQLVLAFRLRGIGRDVAIARAAEEERKWIQAAWKRFDRNGLEKLRAVFTAG
jgi:hypothetical protein